MNPEPTNSERQSATRPRRHRANRVDHRARAHEAFRREVDAATDPNDADDHGEPWLHRAPLRADAVRTLLDRGADPNRTNGRGWTALHVAVIRNDARRARTLLDRGADPNLRDSTGWSPLDHAVARDHGDLARLLLDRGADVRAANAAGATALHRVQTPGLAGLLLDRGADPNERDGSGRTATAREAVARVQFERCAADLERAESGGGQHDGARNVRAIQDLVDGRLAPGNSGTEGDTLLHRAASDGEARLMASLLAHGADPNARNADDEAPLHLASDAASVRLLLRHGADPNAQDNDGDAPLHEAGSPWCARIRLRHVADMDSRNNDGEIPLHKADSTVRVLPECGAEPAIADAAAVAAWRRLVKRPDVAVLLRNRVPDPAAPNDGRRALLDAILETYGDPGAAAELRDDTPLVGLEGRLQTGHIPEGAERVVVTVRLARAMHSLSGIRDRPRARVPNADPNDPNFGLPVAEVRQRNRRMYSR